MNQFINSDAVLGGRIEYQNKLKELSQCDECPFCIPYIEKYHTNPIINEDLWIVTENMFPYAEGKHHLLFIPKRHILNIEDLTQDEWKELYLLMKKYLLEKEIVNGGFFAKFGNTVSVKHLHFHIVQDTKISKVIL